jgi:hypothetical protein
MVKMRTRRVLVKDEGDAGGNSGPVKEDGEEEINQE